MYPRRTGGATAILSRIYPEGERRRQTEKQLPDMNMKNKLYFVPEAWYPNPECPKNSAAIEAVKDFDGSDVQGFVLGNWLWDRSEIMTCCEEMRRRQDYSITFWLSGGENDRWDEVCEFQVIRNEDYEQREVFKLNRSNTIPLKRYNGWRLYELTFNTGNASEIELRFSVTGAVTKVIPALDAESYEHIVSEPEPEYKPVSKRRNIKKFIWTIAGAVAAVIALLAIGVTLFRKISAKKRVKF